MKVRSRCAMAGLPLAITAIMLAFQTGCMKAGGGGAGVNSVAPAPSAGTGLKPLASNCTSSGKKYVRDLFVDPEELDEEHGIAFSSRVDWKKASVLDCGGLVGFTGEKIVFADVELLSENHQASSDGKQDFRKYNSGKHGLLEFPQFDIFRFDIGKGAGGALIEQLPLLLATYLEKEKAEKEEAAAEKCGGTEGGEVCSAEAGTLKNPADATAVPPIRPTDPGVTPTASSGVLQPERPAP